MTTITKDARASPLSEQAAADLSAVYGKIARRIIPFLALLFLMAWLDRYNVGFAKLQMVKDLGFSNAVYGFGAGIVYLGYVLFEIPSNLLLEKIGARKTFARIAILWGVTTMVLAARHSDRTLERRYHAALPCLVCALGLVGIGAFAQVPALAFTALVLAVTGTLSASTIFWQFPPMLLGGTAAAGGIALINSLGASSGWVGPSIVGWLEDLTGTSATGLYVVAGLEVLGAILILLFMPRRSVAQHGVALSAKASP